MTISASTLRVVLVTTVGTRACAIPLEHVVETMRPLPIERIPGAPAFVPGAAVIRGSATAIVDLRSLFEDSQAGTAPGRFVSVRAGDRHFALAVDSVVGVRALDPAQFDDLPPLLQSADTGLVAAIGASDGQFLTLLRTARIVTDDIWATLGATTSGTPAVAVT